MSLPFTMQKAMLPVDEIGEVFEDLAPVSHNDGPDPVCTIQYPTSFVIAYDYMRAVWKSGEKSERALKLSATCLKLNPANYTVWHFRRQCLQTLGLSKDIIQFDLNLAAALGGDNPKNYQIWYHRRALLEKHSSVQEDFLEAELAYIANVVEEDSKNYHAWSHRQWLVQNVNSEDVWKQEIEYANELIQEDARNNSAWNNRWFAVHQGKAGPISLDVAKQEADYAIHTGATLDPFNESPWRYLIGLLKEQPNDVDLYKEYLEKSESLRSILINAHRDPETCSNWTSARIDLLEMIGDKNSWEKAGSLATGLANEHDPIRKKYWMLRVYQLNQKCSSL